MSTPDTPHPILFIPGPVEVDPELRALMAMPLVGHRSQGFKATVQGLLPKLQRLFRTQAHALFENAPATALMEAAIRNLVGARVLHLTNGAFSERWAKISEACGRQPQTLAVAWGEVVTPEKLRAELRGTQPFEAVCITHSETSTGALSPLRELAQVVHEEQPDALVLVDAVTSLAGTKLEFDAWGVDCAFAGTQKALALPPGLCVFAVSERAMAKAKTVPGRGFLFDFPRAADSLAKGETLATPCVPLVFALSRQLDRIELETLDARWQRHAAMQTETAAWCAAHDFSYFVADGFRSPTVSTVNASGRVVTELIAKAKAAGFTLSNGYGKLKDQTFRIGHMGDHDVTRLRALLAALAG
ncbi:MAG: alanine--glyoxylate aminotransferase family protein [Planctomycetota bacterium]